MVPVPAGTRTRCPGSMEARWSWYQLVPGPDAQVAWRPGAPGTSWYQDPSPALALTPIHGPGHLPPLGPHPPPCSGLDRWRPSPSKTLTPLNIHLAMATSGHHDQTGLLGTRRRAIILMATFITWGMVRVPRGNRDQSTQRCNKHFGFGCLVTAVARNVVALSFQ